MTKSKKSKMSKADDFRAETVIDRSTRISRQILKDEAEQHDLKKERLRKARLERDAGNSGRSPD